MRSLSGLQVYFLRLSGSTLGYLLILLVLFLQDFPVDLFDFSYAQISGVITFGALSYCCYYQAIYLLKPIKAMALNITYSIWAIGLGYLSTADSTHLFNTRLVIKCGRHNDTVLQRRTK